MECVRTPDDRFADLPDFPYAPRYLEGLPGFEGLRMHYVDEGPRDAEHTFLCLHGEPSWSFLYRKMLPVFTAAGGRVVAPDMFGFGRSDKPTDDAVYTFGFHRRSLLAFLDALQLERVTLVCQDWGGILGLTLPVDRPQLVDRLIVMNTAIAVGLSPGKGFESWRDFVANSPDLDVGKLMQRAIPGITDAEVAAYDAPFPGPEFKAGVRRFPAIVPITPDMEGAEIGRQAMSFWSTQWSGPTFMAVGAQDPVLGPEVMGMLRQAIRGCPEPMIVEAGGHFVQEHGEPIARAALDAFGR